MLLQEKTQLYIRDNYDVIVAGGGVAGIAAALAARRSGARVLMIEKGTIAGGLATMGLVAIYLPLCDGRGTKVSGGIAEELLWLSIKYGLDTLPDAWKTGEGTTPARYCTNFSPPAFAIAVDELLENEGIDVSYDTLVCRAVMEDNRCTYIIVENKTGRYAYGCKAVVDATGDADIFARAGIACEKGDNGLTYWSYVVDPQQIKKATNRNRVPVDDWLQMGGADEYGEGAPGAFPKYDGTDDRQITRFLLDGRKCLRKEIYEDGKRKDRVILTLPSMPQMRTTRRIESDFVLQSIHANQEFSDSVGCVGDWISAGIVWEIPYRSLYSKRCANLFAAGRCIGSTQDAWQAVRVIPGAAVSGQAAGTAAAMCVVSNVEAWQLDVEKLQTKLMNDGVILHRRI